jgi:hypothetical protein
MNNQMLQKLIDQFSNKGLIDFLSDKNPAFKPNRRLMQEYSSEDFSQALDVGELPFEHAESLGVYSFMVNKALSERSGKKAQYDLAKKVLKHALQGAGIFVFYDAQGNFRFSLVYANYHGTKVDWSTFKRFTYFVSPQLTNKTFLQRVGECTFSSLDEIKDAFSVEKVTNDFFNGFRKILEKTQKEFEEANKYTACSWLKSKYEPEDYQEQVKSFNLTFLGRIIFLYFLLRKGWIEGRSDFIRKIFEDQTKYNLYQEVLAPLFFDVLAKPEKERPERIRQQFKNTPYLNGGLFEHSDLEHEMAKERIMIFYRDDFLRDIILNYFEIYNFTVDENTPTDQEVSIDPEMLGKVFENTLAEEERNQKGTFYTPREVVHFMVIDAIKQYLHNETEISLKTLQMLIDDEQDKLDYLTPNQIRQIDKKLEDIKVLDPATGSAAFPVELMNVIIQLRKRLDVKVGRNINEVSLKKHLIKNSLYGVDVDPGAIEIAKLRLWLALIVDYDKSLAEPLPNLDFQFRVGNALQEKIDGIDIFNEQIEGTQLSYLSGDQKAQQLKEQMINVKDRFYLTENEADKHRLKEEFDQLERQLISHARESYEKAYLEQMQNQKFARTAQKAQETLKKLRSLDQKIKDGTYKLFKPDFHFSEVYDRKDEHGNNVNGFDIVIGNPPYGVLVDKDIQEQHQLGSRDSYGIFISTALKRFLKDGGVLELIVSDTWLTIKTHRNLRQQVLENRIHKIIRLHQDCFNATVNVCILSISKLPSNDNQLIAADLTNISTRKASQELREKLYHLENHIGKSTPQYAVYQYQQALIKKNSNLPIFVASPKLFTLMQDVDVASITKTIGGKQVAVRQIYMNGNLIELVRFGDIAEVKVGLQTGDNKAYLFQNPGTRDSYRDITPYKQYLLTIDELLEIATNERPRLKVIEFGIHKSKDEPNFDPDRWFEGRYIVPYDKGGESDTESGWLPNYYVPTNYFIDWSTWAVNRLKTLTYNERDGKGGTGLCSRFQNKVYYFREGLTLSYTGVYAPNLRLNSLGVFDVGGSSVFSNFNNHMILGNFACKIIKLLGKNFIDHTVNFQVNENKELPLLSTVSDEVVTLVNKIIAKQQENPRYDYLNNEQKEIDQIIYQMYGLNESDILEVETWYARRYPNLAHLCNIKNSTEDQIS